MSAHAIEPVGLLTGRQLVLGVVIGLHALAISALMAMRANSDIVIPDHVFKPVTPITPVTRPVEEKPVLEYKDQQISFRVPDVPRPDFQRPEKAITPPPEPPPGEPPDMIGESLPQGRVVIAPTDLLHRATRSPDDYYPIGSQDQGIAVVRVCVGPTGRMESRPVIERSSGSRQLDAAALKWAGEALAFTPATRNGAAVSACKGFRVNFTVR